MKSSDSSLQGTNVFKTYIIFILVISLAFSLVDIKANVHSQKASISDANKQHSQALRNARTVLKHFRNTDFVGVPMYFYIGNVSYRKGKLKKAKKQYEQALELSPYHSGLLVNYMATVINLGMINKAHQVMEDLVELYPSLATPRLNMAKAYINKEDYERAGKILKELKAQNLDDGLGTLDELIGIIEQRNKRTK